MLQPPWALQGPVFKLHNNFLHLENHVSNDHALVKIPFPLIFYVLFMFCCFLLLGLVSVSIFLQYFVGYFPSIVSDAFVILQTNNVI
jgi:uncharacterized membrane protein (DUF373 family)